MERTFDTPRPIELYVENGAGSITVTAADTAHTEVTVSGARADEFVVEQRDDQVQIVAPKGGVGFLTGNREAHVTVVTPSHSALTIKSGSADTVAHGPLGGLWVNTGSGDVTAELVEGDTEVQSGSGDIRLTELRGPARLKSGSGDVTVGHCADLNVSTGSGDVRIESVGGQLVVKTGSGDVQVGESSDELAMSTGSGDLTIGLARKGRHHLKGASGDMRIGVLAGTPVWTDISTVSGRVRSDLTPVGAPAEGQDHVEIRATTASGDIQLHQVDPHL